MYIYANFMRNIAYLYCKSQEIRANAHNDQCIQLPFPPNNSSGSKLLKKV